MTHVQLTLWAGFAVGVIFGIAAQRSRFCFTGGLREWWGEGNPRRAGALFVALATALLGTQLLALYAVVDLEPSLYLTSTFSWLLIPVGGVLFGIGMMLARSCGSRALVLLASGNLRSLLVFFCLGVSAGIALTGPLATWRLNIADLTAVTLPHASLAQWTGADAVGFDAARLALTLIIALVLLGLGIFRLRLFRYPADIIAAVIVGLTIVAGWWVTGHLGADDFEPVPLESLTFVAPISDALQYLMLASGMRAGFALTVIAGILLGAGITALAAREFRWQGFESPTQMRRAIIGGFLMGVGGALAMGCTVGQGLTGLSTLSISSILAVTGILSGARLGLRWA